MTDDICRGQIRYVTGSTSAPPTGCEMWPDRPALIVSADAMNQNSGCVQIVYLTTSTRKHPSAVHVTVKSGRKLALALCEQVHTVDKSRVKQVIGVISQDEQSEIDTAIMFALGVGSYQYESLFKKWEHSLRHLKHQEAPTMPQSETVLRLKKQLARTITERDAYKSIVEAYEN